MISLGQRILLMRYMISTVQTIVHHVGQTSLYDSWKIEENGMIRIKKYVELCVAEKIQADCDMKATNIILQGLPADIYSISGKRVLSYENGAISSQYQDLKQSSTIMEVTVLATSSGKTRGKIILACTQPKRPRNAAWYKEKAMLAEAQEAGQILDEEQLAFLADPGIPASQTQTVIPHNAAFQTEDLDTYDSDCDDLSSAQAVLMANISNYGSDVILEVPNSKTYLNDMDNQSVHALQDFEQSPVMDFTDNEISSDSNIIPYSQYLQETQQATVQDTNLQAQQDSMILSVIEQMSEQMINLFQMMIQRKENKYMENEIDLEKKIKELDNIVYKVGQSAQTVPMLTKPQAFYDNTHKQALETLILEAESRSKMFEKAKDPKVIAKKISHKPIDYEKLNSLIEDFETPFSPQQELLAEQTFWFHTFNPSIEPSYSPPVIVDVPSELPKVSLVNARPLKVNSTSHSLTSVGKMERNTKCS
ncbi:hypothetical protein Tco_1274053 [Tanacetum coccineum]